MLSFNRMESGQFRLAHSPFAFHSAIQLSVLSQTQIALGKGLELKVELDSRIDDQLGGWFVGDEMRLSQITRYVR